MSNHHPFYDHLWFLEDVDRIIDIERKLVPGNGGITNEDVEFLLKQLDDICIHISQLNHTIIEARQRLEVASDKMYMMFDLTASVKKALNEVKDSDNAQEIIDLVTDKGASFFAKQLAKADEAFKKVGEARNHLDSVWLGD